MENQQPATTNPLCDRFDLADLSKSKRFIFARKLTSESSEYVFEPTAMSEGDASIHEALLIKRATMGSDAKDPSEWNMVEMETQVDTMKLEKFPIAYLRSCDQLQTSLDVMINTTTKITLAKGSGPVYIIGEYMTWIEDDEDYVDEEAEEDVDDIEDEDDMKDESAISDGSAESKENKRPDAPIVLIAKRKLEQTEETIIKKQKLSVTDVPQTEDLKAEKMDSVEDIKAPA